MAYREPELTLRDLDPIEAEALATLVRAIVAADGRLDEEERDALQRLAAEAGEERFWDMMDRAAADMNGPEAVLGVASRVERSEARELIYGALVDLAIAGTIQPSEDAILTRLSELWGIEAREVDEAG